MRTQHVGHFTDYRKDPKTDVYCCICQRDIKDKPGKPRLSIHLINGEPLALHPTSEAEYKPDGGDLGFLRIGPECARKVGMDWCHID